MPTLYTRDIKPMKYGLFAREPNLKDYGNIWSQIKEQEIYPDLTITSVRIITQKETLTDVANFEGYLKIPEHKNLIVTGLSEINFQSIDERCIGRIKRTYDFGNIVPQAYFGAAEVCGGAVLLFLSMAHKIELSSFYGILGSGMLFGGIMTMNNLLYKDRVSIIVGSLYDDRLIDQRIEKKYQQRIEVYERIITTQKMLQRMIEQERLIERPSVEEEKIPDTIDKLIKGFDEDDMQSPTYAAEKLPTYTQEDLDNFKNFVEHIKKVKL